MPCGGDFFKTDHVPAEDQQQNETDREERLVFHRPALLCRRLRDERVEDTHQGNPAEHEWHHLAVSAGTVLQSIGKSHRATGNEQTGDPSDPVPFRREISIVDAFLFQNRQDDVPHQQPGHQQVGDANPDGGHPVVALQRPGGSAEPGAVQPPANPDADDIGEPEAKNRVSYIHRSYFPVDMIKTRRIALFISHVARILSETANVFYLPGQILRGEKQSATGNPFSAEQAQRIHANKGVSN